MDDGLETVVVGLEKVDGSGLVIFFLLGIFGVILVGLLGGVTGRELIQPGGSSSPNKLTASISLWRSLEQLLFLSNFSPVSGGS